MESQWPPKWLARRPMLNVAFHVLISSGFGVTLALTMLKILGMEGVDHQYDVKEILHGFVPDPVWGVLECFVDWVEEKEHVLAMTKHFEFTDLVYDFGAAIAVLWLMLLLLLPWYAEVRRRWHTWKHQRRRTSSLRPLAPFGGSRCVDVSQGGSKSCDSTSAKRRMACMRVEMGLISAYIRGQVWDVAGRWWYNILKRGDFFRMSLFIAVRLSVEMVAVHFWRCWQALADHFRCVFCIRSITERLWNLFEAPDNAHNQEIHAIPLDPYRTERDYQRSSDACASAKDCGMLDHQSETQVRTVLDDGTLCCVCMDALRDTCIFPCGHVALCHECASQLARNSKAKAPDQAGNVCPICRKRIRNVARVYFS